eukprot:4490151-Prymnesium_polylepis.1
MGGPAGLSGGHFPHTVKHVDVTVIKAGERYKCSTPINHVDPNPSVPCRIGARCLTFLNLAARVYRP